MNDALWYVGRGTGVVSLVLLTVVMVLGIGSRSGRPAFGLPRFGVVALHRVGQHAGRDLPGHPRRHPAGSTRSPS